MASQEELNRIFESALQQDEGANPAPATTRPRRVASPAAETEPAVKAEAAPATTAAATVTDPAAKTSGKVQHQSDAELAEMLGDRDQKLQKKTKRARLLVNLLFLGLIGGTATTFAVSPELRGKAAYLVSSIQESVEDVKMMTKGADNYDEALEQVAARSNQIDDATRLLGIDPDSVDEGDDPGMLAEMNAMAGEDMGIDKRLGKLKTMGKIGQALTGAEGPNVGKDKADAADQAQANTGL